MDSSDMASYFFSPLTWDSLKWNIVIEQEPVLPLCILCLMSWNLSRSITRNYLEIKQVYKQPQAKMNNTVLFFFKNSSHVPKLLEKLFLPKPSLLPTSSQVPIQGQWLNTSTGKTVQAEIYSQQDGRMLSSFQGGRKEKPLAVRKEVHFSKALLSLKKGKQDEKSSPNYTVVLT